MFENAAIVQGVGAPLRAELKVAATWYRSGPEPLTDYEIIGARAILELILAALPTCGDPP
jgi:hypothetical protein